MTGDIDIGATADGGPPLILAGHSHLVALIGERHLEAPEFVPFPELSGVTALDGPWPRGDDYWARLVEHAAGADVALMWGGNEHNVCYFFQAAYEFDFLSRHVNKLLGSAQIFTQGRIRKRFMDSGLEQLDSVLTEMTTRSPRRICLLGTPPPKKDSEALRQLLRSEPYFIAWAEQIGHGLDDIKITQPHIRLKLWFLLQEMIAEIARKAGATFVPVPAETQDGDGFLLPEFWKPDVTHANAAYGEIMLRKVLKEMR